MTAGAWLGARRMLCVRLDYLGDVLMATPAMRALRESARGRHITLLTSSGGAAVAPFIPEVDAAIAYDAPWMKIGGEVAGANTPQADLDMIGRLRQENFDAAVIFTTYSQSPLPAALLSLLAGIPLRLAHCRENPYRLLTDWLPEIEPEKTIRHETRRQLDLVAAAGCGTGDERLSFAVPPADADWAAERLARLGLQEGDPWVLLHPGVSAASRRYPAGHWAAVLRQLAELGYPAVLTGSREETGWIESIRRDAGVPSQSLAGELDLGKLGAVIARAPVMVSGNTGPAHIAAALGTPLVDLYALTNLQHTPWQTPHRLLYHPVPCLNCYKSICPVGHHACLERVAPAAVVDAAIDLLKQEPAGAAPPAAREAPLAAALIPRA